MEPDIIEHRLDELRKALDVGLMQLEREAYTDYTKDTLQHLVDEVKAAGRKQLEKSEAKRAL